jgi:protein-tyrosine kinase
MERIQAAIEKARAERRQQGGEAPPPASAAAPQAGADRAEDADLAARWSAITPYTARRNWLSRSRIVAAEGGQEAAAFDVLRTKTLQQMKANGWKKLAVTSATPGCGKSTITLNLGFGLARQKEQRVIVAELDLRRPSLVRMVGQEPPGSFADVLNGQAALADVALRQGDNLALAMNRGPVRNPAELLHRSSVTEALATIKAEYQPDVMIFDMPPMLVSDDAMAIMGQMDCVLLIAAAEKTTARELDICEREAASQSNILGVVLNKCRYMGPDYGYSYYS